MEGKIDRQTGIYLSIELKQLLIDKTKINQLTDQQTVLEPPFAWFKMPNILVPASQM